VKIPGKTIITILATLLLISPVMAIYGCDGSNGTKEPTKTTEKTPIIDGKVKITIGNHTDITGVSSNAQIVITKALKDMAAYYTDNEIIPGIEFKVESYDGQFDPAKDIPGYEWLKNKGADVMFTGVAATTVTLKPMLEEDEMVMFTVMPEREAFEPPGWVFGAGQISVQYEIYTLLEWIAENDPDFPQDRPARIGGTCWEEPYGMGALEAMEKYAKAHPDLYEWVDGPVNHYTFIWDTEVQMLKDCDYVHPPIPPQAFLKTYRDAGYKAKFIGTDAHIAFLGLLGDAGLWDFVDGHWLVKPAQWWTDEGPVLDLTHTLLETYRADEIDNIRRTGVSYLATQQIYVMFELIKATAEAVGPENVNSRTIYDTAQSFSIIVDGCPHSYNPNKTTSSDALAVYYLNAEDQEMYRADDAWLPVIYEP